MILDCFLYAQSSNLPAIIATLTFAAVILSIALDWLDLAVAGLLGAIFLRLLGIVSKDTAVSGVNAGLDTIGLFFGGMVVARALVPTGIFDYLGAIVLRIVRGDGRRLLLSIIVLTAPICAILPNATVVILFAPLLIRVCRKMEIDFAPPIMLLVFVANASGLLTLVGDPATFIVGNSIGMSFVGYLYSASLGGLLSLIALALMLPFSFRSIWRTRAAVDDVEIPKIEHFGVLIIGVVILVLMVTLFIVGADLPSAIGPAGVAILGAALLLLTIYLSGIDTVSGVLKDVDWETLLFFICIFVIVGALDTTGAIAAVGSRLRRYIWQRTQLRLVDHTLDRGSALQHDSEHTAGRGDGAGRSTVRREPGVGDRGATRRWIRPHSDAGDAFVLRDDVRSDAGRQRNHVRRVFEHRRGGDLRA